MSDFSAIERTQAIKLRHLQISATLAAWKHDYFSKGIERPFSERTALEAESAALALEARQILNAAHAERIAQRVRQGHSLLSELLRLLKERDMQGLIDEAQARADAAATPEAIAAAIERTPA